MVSLNKKTILIISIFLSIFSIIKSEDERPPCKTVANCVYCPLIHQCEICEKEYSLNDDKSTCIYHMSHIYGLSKFGKSNNDEVDDIEDIKFILFKIIFCVVLLVLLIVLLIYICYIGSKNYDLNANRVKKVSIK